MDIYDKVADLALSIRETPEFAEWLEVKELIEQTVEEKTILQKYRTCQLAMEFAGLADTSDDYLESVRDELDDVCMVMERNPLLSRYLDAEECFCNMLNRMQQIFAKNIEFPVEELFVVNETGGFLN